jgi:pilus assembly protein CpaF
LHVLGYGPLEPLLARDEIADIMVNGSGRVYIEVGGKIQKTGIRFRDNQQQHLSAHREQIGRRVNEASLICDALAERLACQCNRAAARDRRAGAHHPQFPQGQAHARAIGPLRTISPEGAEILKVIDRRRVNVLISGGTGSGKTTLL